MSTTRQQFAEVMLMRLRSELLEHKAIIDAYLESPLTSIKDEVYFSDIVEHAKAMALLENAYRIVQGTYMPLPEPLPEPTAQEAEVAAAPITEGELASRSPTYRKSQKKPVKKKAKADK